ncbi:hypothetical protein [Ancylobacter radicis]|uniref:hypothetical protein n=1 Tax=Ancylobacter radicis TaxID=2836179 RepID=UPI002022F28D|nr:hypothetical protein [Ancylobacter radicis]
MQHDPAPASPLPEPPLALPPLSEPIIRIFGNDAVARLMAKPGFDAAVKAAARSAIRNYDSSWIRNRLMNDRGRFLAALLILDLHFGESGGAGVTGARLRREVVELGVCSPGRATAFLAALRFAGFLALHPDSSLRERRLVPTPRFLQLHRERWDRMFEAIAHLAPAAAAQARDLPDQAVFGPGTHALADVFRRGVRVFDAAPELRFFAERDAGLVSLVTLIAADGTVSISQLARQFAVSRAHIAQLMREAERRGLAQPAAAGNGYQAGPALWPAIARFYALIFLIFQAAAAVAQAEPA